MKQAIPASTARPCVLCHGPTTERVVMSKLVTQPLCPVCWLVTDGKQMKLKQLLSEQKAAAEATKPGR